MPGPGIAVIAAWLDFRANGLRRVFHGCRLFLPSRLALIFVFAVAGRR